MAKVLRIRITICIVFINRIPGHHSLSRDFSCSNNSMSGIFYHHSFAHPKKSSIFADMKQEIIDKINRLASQDEPFLFVINYQGDKSFIRLLSDINPEECLFDFEGRGNWRENHSKEMRDSKRIYEDISKEISKEISEEISEKKFFRGTPLDSPISWQITPPLYKDYERSFGIVKSNIMGGNSYLTNLTCKVPVSCNLSLEDIFHRAKGKYKLMLKRNENLNPFVCFSPETFVRIKNGRIYSYPMKGTLDASLPDAEKLLMEDEKEAAEHATIVDLIRNDLSRVAEDVKVDKYRYIDVLHTNKGDILQTSSEISGRLPEDYRNHLGEILDAQLPAGSITGAPKDKTMQIIHEAEGYDRGFYTGIMGIYDQGELNSAVMIRFVEEETSPVDFEADGEKNFKASEGKRDEASRKLYFKAGGGITSKSDCRKEYEEVIQKIYLPI